MKVRSALNGNAYLTSSADAMTEPLRDALETNTLRAFHQDPKVRILHLAKVRIPYPTKVRIPY